MKENSERCIWRKIQFSKSEVSLYLEHARGKALAVLFILWRLFLLISFFSVTSLPPSKGWLNGKVISIQDNTGNSLS